MTNNEDFYMRLCHILMKIINTTPDNFIIIPLDEWHATYNIPPEKLADIDSFIDIHQKKIIFTRKQYKQEE